VTISPETIRDQITAFLHQLAKAPEAHYQAELKKEQAALDYQKRYDVAFLTALGNIEERKAVARQEAAEEQWSLSTAEAEFNRIRLKTRQLEQSVMASQSLLRSIQSEGA
jgi:hypothetical protein